MKQFKGGPGVDGMTVGEQPAYLVAHCEAIREQLLAGVYQPQPVRRAEIPKPGGGTRQLGIPTVLDRFLQQCLLDDLPSIRAVRDSILVPGAGGLRA